MVSTDTLGLGAATARPLVKRSAPTQKHARARATARPPSPTLRLTTTDITPPDCRMRGAGFASVLFALGCGAAVSCGSRTELTMVDPCETEGDEIPCRGECGEGTRRCQDGYYRDCVVPPVERACSNQCGSGVERCEDDRWGECVTPYVERGCENVCGRGVQGCSDGRWQECNVPPAT